jgi:hypothetical protein
MDDYIMKTLPKFLIAHNMAADPDGLYIIHTQYPAFIAQALPQNGAIIRVGDFMDKYPIAARTNAIDGVYYIIPVIKWFDELPEANQAEVNKTAKLMSRMGDWFYSQLKNRNHE